MGGPNDGARPPSRLAGLLYGLGFGGFVEVAGLEANTLADGIFHLASWGLAFLAFGALLLVGGWLLHRRGVRQVHASAEAQTVHGVR